MKLYKLTMLSFFLLLSIQSYSAEMMRIAVIDLKGNNVAKPESRAVTDLIRADRLCENILKHLGILIILLSKIIKTSNPLVYMANEMYTGIFSEYNDIIFS